MTTNSNTYLTILHSLLNQHFNLAEIRTVCFNLNVDYESISGEEKPSRIRGLLLALGRNGRLPELITLAQQQRPHVTWLPVPDDFQLPKSLASGDAVPPTQYHIYGDVVQGDKISVGNIEWSVAAVGAGAVSIASRGIYVSGDVNAPIYTGNITVNALNSLPTYIENKLTEWDKPETTTQHIPLAARTNSYSLAEEIENKDKPVPWSSIPDVKEAVDTFKGGFVLLGDPGSGKSTLLRKFAYNAAVQYKKASGRLPILLDLSQWPAQKKIEGSSQEEPTFEHFLEEHFYRQTKMNKEKEHVPYTSMLLLLDGLNEMAGDIAAKVTQINAFLHKKNVVSKPGEGLQVIVSCRHHAYTETIILDLPRVVVEPLSDQQIQSYLHWKGCEPLSPFLFEPTGTANKQLSLVRHPFFLRILTELYQENVFNLIDPVYRNCATILDKFTERLWQHEREKLQDRPLTRNVPEVSIVKLALEQLGYDIKAQGDETVISARLTLQSFLEANKLSDQAGKQLPKTQQSAEFLLHLCENAGILKLSQDGTQVKFDPEFLQEYFAACYLHRRWKKDRNRHIYRYLGETGFSLTEQYREQGNWDEVWFTFANLCNSVDLDAFIKDIISKEPFLAAEIASHTEPSQKCFNPLITQLIRYARADERCDKWWNCRKLAIYALSNFTTTEAITAIAHLLYKRDFYRVSRVALWRIGQRIGILALLQSIQAGRKKGDDTVWGIFIHHNTGDTYFTFEFFKFQWLFDRDLYRRDQPSLTLFCQNVFEHGWTSLIKEVFVADAQEVVKLVEQLPPISSSIEILAYIPDRSVLEACLRLLPRAPATYIVPAILNNPTLTSEDILYLLQHERTDIRDETICGINPKTERISVKHELLNQFDIAFRLIQLWYSSDQPDVLSIDARWALLSIEPAYVLPALAEFLQQVKIPTQKAGKVIDRIIEPLVTNYPFSYESNYKEISDWLLDLLTSMPAKPESVHVLAARALRIIKPPGALPVFIKLAGQGWSDCIDALAEMELGEYAEEAKKALLLALRNQKSGLAAMVLAKWQVFEAVPILVALAQENSQNRSLSNQTQSRIVTALSLFKDRLSEVIEVFKMELKNVPITRDLNYTRDLEPSVCVISMLAPEETANVLVDLLNRFCITANEKKQDPLYWSHTNADGLSQAIGQIVNLFKQVHHLDGRSVQTLERTTSILFDIVKHDDGTIGPFVGFRETLNVIIRLLGDRQIETAVPLLHDMLNDSKFSMNIWETIIHALGQIGTEAAIIALCGIYKNRGVVYQEWDHDALSGLATKAIIEIGTKPAFDICFSSLYAIDSRPEDLSHFEWFWLGFVGREIRAIEQPSTLEHLIQAWVDTRSKIAQDLIATTCLVHMPECVPFIIQYAIPDPERRVRLYALHILNKFDIGLAIEGIFSLSRDKDTEICEAAIWALAEKRDVRAIDGLAQMIQYPPQIKGAEWNTFRKEAVDLLIEIEDPQTDSILESLSKSKDSDVRSWGKYGLQKRKGVAKQKETLYRVPPLPL